MSLHRPASAIYLKGLEATLPERLMTNDDVAAWMDAKLRGSWIEQKTGIRERHWVSEEQACSDLAYLSASRLLEAFPEEHARVRQLVLATISGDYLTPPTSPLLQERLGLQGVGAFDLGAACAGFVTGLHVSSSLVSSTGDSVLLVACDIRSKFLDRRDLSTSALFGDGSAACFVTAAREGAAFRYLASRLFSDGSVADIISIPSGGSRAPYTRSPAPETCHLKMQQGAALFVKAVEGMTESARQFLGDLGLTIGELDWVVPHQANLHLLREVAKRLQVPSEKVVETVQVTGNTSGASVGIALEALQKRQVTKAGQKVLLVSAGGGGLAACALLEAMS
ncbi:MAG: ketoacyl-ACP synthase III [Oligoflexia bacterium]|nr:ketoacyl-ACP synthase III [Oligoflexia bacterium]